MHENSAFLVLLGHKMAMAKYYAETESQIFSKIAVY